MMPDVYGNYATETMEPHWTAAARVPGPHRELWLRFDPAKVRMFRPG
jgi:hypothetical protein